MQRRKKFPKILMVIMAIVPLLLPSKSFAGSTKSDKPVASVNGTILLERDIGEYIQRVFPAGIFHGLLDPEKMKKYRKEAIDLMIDDELLYQYAKEKGFEAKQNEVDEAEEKVIKRLQNEKTYEATLRQEGLTREGFRGKLEKRILLEKLMKREVEEKAEMTDADAKAFYKENKKTYMRPETRRLSHILIKVEPNATSEEWEAGKKRAEEARAKIVNGTDFADVAWDYSDDPYRVKGGDLGLIHKGRLVSDLEDVVWKLKKGELSDVIKTIYGYHIVRVEEIIPQEQMTYDQVKDKIKTTTYEKRSKELKDALLEGLREKATIERYEE